MQKSFCQYLTLAEHTQHCKSVYTRNLTSIYTSREIFKTMCSYIQQKKWLKYSQNYFITPNLEITQMPTNTKIVKNGEFIK